MIKYHVFYAELMCLGELISRLNSQVSCILSYVENFLTSFAIFLPMGGALLMHILHGKKIERKFFGPFAQLSSRR